MIFENKKVALLGAGRSNLAVMKYVAAKGAIITLYEQNEKRITDEFYKYCADIKTGDEYSDAFDCDILVKTPVIRLDSPLIVQAQKQGIVITSEVEIFFENTNAKIIAVTGSSGKTTTTTLIYEMLRSSGLNAYIGGNIGIPLLEYTKLCEKDIIAAELSSFQLSSLKKAPHTAVVTNIYPNHLDVHKDFDEYINAKKNIVKYSPEKAVLNFDDEIVRNFNGAKKNIYFSMKSEAADIYFKNGYIYLFGEKFFDASKIKIPGMFNIKNYMAAAAAVYDIGVKEKIIKAAEEFRGVAHRNELAAEINGVKYFDSSIDSSPDRTAATLSAYRDKVILLAGGKGKGIPYDSLEKPFKEKVKLAIITGENADELIKVCENAGIKWINAENYRAAVQYAKKNARIGDKVLLSPASTSFDAFENFEKRGDFFKQCVIE